MFERAGIGGDGSGGQAKAPGGLTPLPDHVQDIPKDSPGFGGAKAKTRCGVEGDGNARFLLSFGDGSLRGMASVDLRNRVEVVGGLGFPCTASVTLARAPKETVGSLFSRRRSVRRLMKRRSAMSAVEMPRQRRARARSCPSWRRARITGNGSADISGTGPVYRKEPIKPNGVSSGIRKDPR